MWSASVTPRAVSPINGANHSAIHCRAAWTLRRILAGEQQEDGVNPQGIDPKLIDSLNRASSLELFQLSAIVERMLADPRRIIAVRVNMDPHFGMSANETTFAHVFGIHRLIQVEHDRPHQPSQRFRRL